MVSCQVMELLIRNLVLCWGMPDRKTDVIKGRKRPMTKQRRIAPGNARGPNSGQFSRERQPEKRGRRPGSRNHYTREIRDAVLNACNRYGSDGRGEGGLEGYMFLLCHKERKSMAMLLGRILPEQVHLSGTREIILSTAEELRRTLAERGLQVDRIYPKLKFEPIKQQDDVEVLVERDSTDDKKLST
jgi:hypothetical protein